MKLSNEQKQHIERLASGVDEGVISAIGYCQRQFKCSFWDAKELVESVTSGGSEPKP